MSYLIALIIYLAYLGIMMCLALANEGNDKALDNLGRFNGCVQFILIIIGIKGLL